MMTKFTSKDAPTFSARLYHAEIEILKRMAEHLGLRGVADMFHHIASAEAIALIISADTSAEMTSTSKRLRALLEKMNQDDYEALESIVRGVAAALDYAATIRAEFEQDQQEEAGEK